MLLKVVTTQVRDGFNGNAIALAADTQFALLGDIDRKVATEHIFREALRPHLGPPVNLPGSLALVDLAIEAAIAGVSMPTTPLSLLEDLFDTAVLAVCEQAFAYMEGKREIWIAAPFDKQLCATPLKRRLSRAQNTVFCGRILMFLASVTPLSDKSGVNQISAFNSANVTTFEDDEPSAAAASTHSADAMAAPRPSDVAMDFRLYQRLWSLQRFFNDPTLCYVHKEWVAMAHAVDALLAAFRSAKLDTRATDVHAAPVAAADVYFAKYLTSPKLMDLQLADGNFRRQILTQCVILFRYLVATVKFKKATHVLTPAQATWVEVNEKAVFELMVEVPPNGAEFAAAIRHIMDGEQSWVEWKNDGCPSMELPAKSAAEDEEEVDALAQPAAPPPAKRLRSAAGKAAGPASVDMGCAELSRLWSLRPNLAACADPRRKFQPAPNEYFADALAQLAPDAAPLAPEAQHVNDAGFGWRALRLLGKTRLHFFQEFSEKAQFKTLPEYLKHALSKVRAEIEPPPTAARVAAGAAPAPSVGSMDTAV